MTKHWRNGVETQRANKLRSCMHFVKRIMIGRRPIGEFTWRENSCPPPGSCDWSGQEKVQTITPICIYIRRWFFKPYFLCFSFVSFLTKRNTKFQCWNIGALFTRCLLFYRFFLLLLLLIRPSLDIRWRHRLINTVSPPHTPPRRQSGNLRGKSIVSRKVGDNMITTLKVYFFMGAFPISVFFCILRNTYEDYTYFKCFFVFSSWLWYSPISWIL